IATSSTTSLATPWVQEWITCLFTNSPNGQNICTHIAQRHLPNRILTEVVFTLFMTLGVPVSLCVGTSRSLYREFMQVWFPGIYGRFQKKGNSSPESGSSPKWVEVWNMMRKPSIAGGSGGSSNSASDDGLAGHTRVYLERI
ncbi:hypothetical protein HK102_005724, partial [Quaeritorhiza haematococci]